MQPETNAARAAEIARGIRVYRDRLRGIDEAAVAAAITAALDEAEARGMRKQWQASEVAKQMRDALNIEDDKCSTP